MTPTQMPVQSGSLVLTATVGPVRAAAMLVCSILSISRASSFCILFTFRCSIVSSWIGLAQREAADGLGVLGGVDDEGPGVDARAADEGRAEHRDAGAGALVGRRVVAAQAQEGAGDAGVLQALDVPRGKGQLHVATTRRTKDRRLITWLANRGSGRAFRAQPRARGDQRGPLGADRVARRLARVALHDAGGEHEAEVL